MFMIVLHAQLPLIRDAERKRISELDAEAQRLSNKSVRSCPHSNLLTASCCSRLSLLSLTLARCVSCRCVCAQDPFYIIHDEWLVHWRRFVTQGAFLLVILPFAFLCGEGSLSVLFGVCVQTDPGQAPSRTKRTHRAELETLNSAWSH